ncbi:hypothetical protein BU25DRAFT_436858 [Macroventuria anomochaeta]|uniref:Uncharacterized protein n=1 Tax=Macroventuria anomochaeta TaxID=301207 RepID=A0ACB6SCW9_9PLEO|nr:uncharacterized protein BU25DRAFT_436858 [Macroventuria anomochaeta]KAF2632056.1 hypothetical protein BU25DRAFT_436858 [Macroventuria anomochaeta]
MRDPIPPLTMLVHLSQPLADKLDLRTMPYHVHEILLGFLAYYFILYGLSPAISQLVCPKTYTGFNWCTRLNSDTHWVSKIQALFINGAALYGFAAGYFLWDLQVCLQHFRICGAGALVHATGCSGYNVHWLQQKPFGNYYGLSFILYELSTPFLNVHWFCDKLGLTGSKPQLYDGIALLFTFFACCIVWGTYYCEITELPMWLVTIYLVGNTALSILSIYWFSQMVKAVRKRFVPAEEVKAKKDK